MVALWAWCPVGVRYARGPPHARGCGSGRTPSGALRVVLLPLVNGVIFKAFLAAGQPDDLMD